MSTGKIVAQCGHAVEHLTLRTPKTIQSDYRRNAGPKIALQVKSGEEFDTIRDICQKAKIQIYTVKDAGKTQVAAGTRTVLGIGPVSKKYLPQEVADLKLL